MEEKKLLEQTKSKFKVVGKVTRIDKDGAYDTGTSTKGKSKGKTFRKLKFGVQTSNDNNITVEMYQSEPNDVYMWHSENAKKTKEAGGKHKMDKFTYGHYEKNKDSLSEQGYAILSPKVGFEYDKDGKLITKGIPAYDMAELVYNELNNGDFVKIEGEIRYSRYKNQQDVEVERTNYSIDKCYKLNYEVDFNAEDFKEVSYFEQEIVFVDVDIDEELGKAYVIGRAIDYKQDFIDKRFVINYRNEDGTNNDNMVNLANTFKTVASFGDTMNIFGDTINKVVIKETEAPEEEVEEVEDPFASFSEKPKHAVRYTQRDYISEMVIHGVEKYTAGVYSEEDFVRDDLIDEGEVSKEDNPFAQAGQSNPFELKDNDGTDDEEDDDLPF